jgi:hypothetical protein
MHVIIRVKRAGARTEPGLFQALLPAKRRFWPALATSAVLHGALVAAVSVIPILITNLLPDPDYRPLLSASPIFYLPPPRQELETPPPRQELETPPPPPTKVETTPPPPPTQVKSPAPPVQRSQSLPSSEPHPQSAPLPKRVFRLPQREALPVAFPPAPLITEVHVPTIAEIHTPTMMEILGLPVSGALQAPPEIGFALPNLSLSGVLSKDPFVSPAEIASDVHPSAVPPQDGFSPPGEAAPSLPPSDGVAQIGSFPRVQFLPGQASPPVEAIRKEHPASGSYDIVVVQSGASSGIPLAAGILKGTPVYLVYLDLGLPKMCILQFAALSPDSPISSPIVNLVDTAALAAPYPSLTLVPKRIQERGETVLIHGFVTAAGRFRDISILGSYDPGSMFLAMLREWIFRPARRGNQPVEVEVVLAI